ncbi:multidrug effflux MFS transporter [Alteraurantiacibacter aquimixticola]|uniref:Bcr/CflA family efflux transporter n=1 Tax=Alteraurantiacibacter aquimixticola TaxID=2489173 RepID=A0A4T3EZY5_9SPHN|nr:multidrug effflux MFS transporter [Alteraurantiacibacter aquimixticola]TIX49724.1 Bcr/CflA family efflux MFS transporter [Alteraurantiacibacter aquimixticola]
MSTVAEPLDSMPMGKRELIVLLALLMSLNALSIDAMLPALDDMARELGATDGNRRQLVVAIYSITMGMGCLIPGSYADRYGRRPILLFSLACYAGFSLLVAVLHQFNLVLVARALGGLLSAGLMVAPMAIVRDLYEGDKMARLMSVVAAVFITVPVIAPSFGQAVLLVAGWRWIFVALAAVGGLAACWVYFRLPETLRDEHRQEIILPVIARNMKDALLNRQSIGYVLGTLLVMGGVFAYVNIAQQLYSEHFGVSEAAFPIVFGSTAAMMAFANITNSRIVMRFGARRVSHTGVLVFIVVSALQVWASYYHPGDISWFVPLTAINLGLLGFLGANFGSIAMQPFAHIAGAASSVQSFFRMFGAAMVGLLIGQLYDGTARPFAWALLICSTLALCFVLYSEEGRLFRRLNVKPPKERIVP